MSAEESWNLKKFLKALGLLPNHGREDPAWEIPALRQVQVAMGVLGGTLGEPSKHAVARRILDLYKWLTDVEKVEFFEFLLEEYEVDAQELKNAYRVWESSQRSADLVRLIQEVEPKRQHLLRNLNHAEGATLELVEMRTDLLRLIKSGYEYLKPLDYDFRHLLSSWFNPGFLRLDEIGWDTAKAVSSHMLKYEAVHPMANIGELKKRVQPRDRKMYGFTHPATGELPLIFVEVAFVNGLPETIDEILEHPQTLNPLKADTAVFYSINSAFDGLAGISFGNLLIKRVTELIQSSLPNIGAFVTLSPLPRLRRWLESSHQPEHQTLVRKLKQHHPDRMSTPHDDVGEQFAAAAGQYITAAKNTRGLPLDPVARFHLGNGATAWQIVWPASSRDYIWEKSFGGMIIYRYEPEQIDSQHEEFVRHNRISVGPYFPEPTATENLELSEREQSEVHVDRT